MASPLAIRYIEVPLYEDSEGDLKFLTWDKDKYLKVLPFKLKQLKAVQYFSVVLGIMLYRVAQNFDPVNASS